MTSSFHGLETSRRALTVYNTAMLTVGHNVANANTEGYSRQRVQMSATRPIEAPGFMRSVAPGQLGTGVQTDEIVRVRDRLVDVQYRRENAFYSEWTVRESTLQSLEELVNEPSATGLSAVMNQFWNAWEALNRDPALLSARIEVVGKGKALTETLHHIGRALTQTEADLASNISVKIGEANVLIQQIAGLNDTIRRIEGLNDRANDLRDQRDLLVDKLSAIVDVQVEELSDGTYRITAAGKQVVDGVAFTLLAAGDEAAALSGQLAGYRKSITDVQRLRDQLNAMVDTLVRGQVRVTLPAGYVASQDIPKADGSGVVTAGTVLTAPTEVLVDGFNGLHRLGYGLGEPPSRNIPFFTGGGPEFTIDNIEVNPAVESDTNLIAASGKFETISGSDRPIRGNGDIAHALASLRDFRFTFMSSLTPLASGTTDDYFRAVVGNMGTLSSEATRNRTNQEALLQSASMRRSSISGVSTDEEVADLIKFQHAYGAAARHLTAVDEMLDRIINRTGLVGR